jgi:hypothetical protein
VSFRIRNGVDLSVLGAQQGADGLSLPAVSARVQTEWSGGMQSVTTYSQAGQCESDEAVYLIRCDDSHDRCGDNTAPSAIGLAATALASGFLQGFVIEAAVRDVPVDAVLVELELSEPESDTDAAARTSRCRIVCSVDSRTDIAQLRAIAFSAVKSAPVVRLLRDPPIVVVAPFSAHGSPTQRGRIAKEVHPAVERRDR